MEVVPAVPVWCQLKNREGSWKELGSLEQY